MSYRVFGDSLRWYWQLQVGGEFIEESILGFETLEGCLADLSAKGNKRISHRIELSAYDGPGLVDVTWPALYGINPVQVR